MRSGRSEKGAALLEAAITIPILLLIAVGIFEFGRAYQTWQILTNAAREGARVACVQSPNGVAEQRVRDYMEAGNLENFDTADVDVDQGSSITVNGTAVSASRVTVDYPFSFIVIGPVAQLISPGSSLGEDLVMTAEAVMRNEVAGGI